MSLYSDPKPFCYTCHGSWEIQISEGVTVTAFHCNLNTAQKTQVLAHRWWNCLDLTHVGEDEFHHALLVHLSGKLLCFCAKIIKNGPFYFYYFWPVAPSLGFKMFPVGTALWYVRRCWERIREQTAGRGAVVIFVVVKKMIVTWAQFSPGRWADAATMMAISCAITIYCFVPTNFTALKRVLFLYSKDEGTGLPAYSDSAGTMKKCHFKRVSLYVSIRLFSV